MPFYAVRVGRKPGVYESWYACKKQIEKFAKARYKKFSTEHDAVAFVKGFDKPTLHDEDCYLGTHTTSNSYNNGPQQVLQETPDSSNLSSAVRLKIAEKEIEYLKEQLRLKEAENKLLQTRAELNELKSQAHSKSPSSMKSTPHKNKPYDRYQKTANSSNWKQNRAAQFIDLDEARQIHTAASCSQSDGRSPVVYTDGACVNNGQGGARAGIGVYWGPDHPMNTSERLPGRQTNNRAEIHAVVKAAQQARQSGFEELTVKTDSMFLINSMTKWLPGWKKKGWKTSTGNPVINREDFEALIAASQGVNINWVHVRGHQGIDGNEKADSLAVQGANMPELD